MDICEQEKLIRQAACLGLPRSVGGYQVVPLTLRKFTALKIMRSPYLPPFSIPKPEDTLAFLWILSPDYLPGNGRDAIAARKQFYRQEFSFCPPVPPIWKTRLAMGRYQVALAKSIAHHQLLIALLRGYVAESLQDAPPAVERSEIRPPEYYCDAVAIATELAREFGGGLDMYFDMPIDLLLQASKEVREHHCLKNGKPVVLHNPSDSIADAELEEINRTHHKSGAKMHPAAIQYFNARN